MENGVADGSLSAVSAAIAPWARLTVKGRENGNAINAIFTIHYFGSGMATNAGKYGDVNNERPYK